jgi:hypothetical protein
MSLKRLPLDDLAVAKPVGPRALALVSDFTRFEPADFDSPEPDHSVASRHEALREDPGLHGLISRFKPIAHLVVPAQPRPAWSLEHNLGIVQREKLVNVIPPIEEFDPPARDCDVQLRHVRTLSLGGTDLSLRGEIPVCLCQGPTGPPIRCAAASESRRPGEARATPGMDEVRALAPVRCPLPHRPGGAKSRRDRGSDSSWSSGAGVSGSATETLASRDQRGGAQRDLHC